MDHFVTEPHRVIQRSHSNFPWINVLHNFIDILSSNPLFPPTFFFGNVYFENERHRTSLVRCPRQRTNLTEKQH